MNKPLFSISMTLANCLVISAEKWAWRNGPPSPTDTESQADWNAETVSMLASGALCVMAGEALIEDRVRP